LACRPVVEADPQRIGKETAAWEIRKTTKVDMGDPLVLFKNDGFTVDKLMKDVRFRVNAALSNAGIVGSAYANELLRGLPSHQGA
jgi:hypothetical protein